ncbi:MAG: gamma-glutamylcyclotransferase family protein [Candidatus Hydrogenedentota bacterium]
MPLDTHIAGKKTVAHWLDLRKSLLASPEDPAIWEEAYDFLYKRIHTRFLGPIDKILEIGADCGEGHAAMALQCILVEFLQALHEGLVYRSKPFPDEIDAKSKELGVEQEKLGQHKQPSEYSASAQLFKSFLTTHSPWKEVFKRRDVDYFFSHVRCGLLHEAATKKGSLVRAQKRDAPETVAERTSDGLVVYRTAFQKALLAWLGEYRGKLTEDRNLQQNFVRKMDDIAQIRRCWYFAYGSNMKEDRLKKRVKTHAIHRKYIGYLCDYKFSYNKKSKKDGSAMANIIAKDGERVFGVCYEMDAAALEELQKYEGGYRRISVWCHSQKNVQDELIDIECETFVSENTTSNMPSREYVMMVLCGACEHGLPDDYVQQFLISDV